MIIRNKIIAGINNFTLNTENELSVYSYSNISKQFKRRSFITLAYREGRLRMVDLLNSSFK